MPAPTLTALTHADLGPAIKAIVETAVTAAGTGTKVFSRQLLALEDGAEPNAFLDGAEPGEGKVNAIMFWPASILPPPAAFSPLSGRQPAPFDPRNVAQVGGLNRQVFTYFFKFYYQFDDGTEEENSTNTIMGLIAKLEEEFGKAPKLNLNSYRIDRHGGLAWPELKTQPFGDITAHICNGALSVLIHSAAQG